jgi:hypothetical protein
MLCVVSGDQEDLVRVGADGVVRPVGNGAGQRMRGCEGSYWVLPAPPGLIVMRGADGVNGGGDRPCVLCGEIRSAGAVCDAVSFIGNAGYQGELLVLERAVSRSIFCDRGQVIGAESSVPTEHLGEVLYRYGVVTEEQLYACSEEAAFGAMRVGEAAIKLGFVTREKVSDLAGRQAEEIFFGTMQTGEGMFYFLDGHGEASVPFRQALPMATLAREGGRRMHEARYFRSIMPSVRHVPVRVPDQPAPEGDPNPVFELIDGERSIADLCRALGQGEYDVSRAIFQLIQSGHVVIGAPHVAPLVAVDVCNRAVALIVRELDAMDQGDAVREQLAAYATEPRVHAQLFSGAGPADDGTFDAQRVVGNLSKWENPADAGERLPAWLHEYASHALSLAQPLVRRREQAPACSPFGEIRPKLSQRVDGILQPIASHVPATKAPPR